MIAPLKQHDRNYQQDAAFFGSHAAAVGAMAGAASFVVSAFFGYDCLYPATITVLSIGAWAGTELYLTPQQKVLKQEFKSRFLSFLPQSVRKHQDNPPFRNVHLSHLALKPPDHSPKWVEFKKWPPVISADSDEFHPNPNFFGIIKDVFSSSHERIEVSAFSNGTGLKYVTHRLVSFKSPEFIQSGDIQLQLPINEMIACLKNYFVALEDDGTPVFSQSFHTLSSSMGKPYKIELLSRKNDLIWNIYDARLKNVISIKKISLSKRCSEETLNFFKNPHIRSLKDRVLLQRECVLKDETENAIYLEPIHRYSHFNKDVLVSKFMWAVTLIRNEGSSGKHAEIIIEGINDGFFSEDRVPIGKYFMYFTDLAGDMKIKVNGAERLVRDIRAELINENKIKFEARSEIWKRTSKRVKQMILEIERERDHPPEGFARYGRHSILASISSIFGLVSKGVVEESCITWAIGKLSNIDIRLEEKTCALLFTNTSFYTKFKPDQEDHKPKTDHFFKVHESKLI